MTDQARDAAIRALCDFAEQPHPGRAGEAIDALERYLRASQPATETTKTDDGPTLDWCPSCQAYVDTLPFSGCERCQGETMAKKPAPQPVEGVSDEEPTNDDLSVVYLRAADDGDGYNDVVRGRRALFNLGASRSSAAKDARIAELEAALADVRTEAIGAGPYRREALGRIVEKVDAARRIREEPAK